jgi:hypothetical protein
MSVKVQLHNVAMLRIRPHRKLESEHFGTFYTRDFAFIDRDGNVMCEVQTFGIEGDHIGWVDEFGTDHPEDYPPGYDGGEIDGED